MHESYRKAMWRRKLNSLLMDTEHIARTQTHTMGQQQCGHGGSQKIVIINNLHWPDFALISA